MTRKVPLDEERLVTFQFVVVSMVVFAAGILLVYWAADEAYWKGHELWQVVIRQLGSSLLTTVALSVIWQLAGKRAFLGEILAKVGISKELKYAGIKQVTDSFHQEIDWPEMFRNATRLDIFFAYAQTWRSNNVTQLRDLTLKPNARIRVVMPDPGDTPTISELAKRFGSNPDAVREKILEARSHFVSLRRADQNGTDVEIYFLTATPLFSWYCFDNEAVLALYNHRPGKAPVPTFVIQRGGTLWEHFTDQFDWMIGAAARQD